MQPLLDQPRSIWQRYLAILAYLVAATLLIQLLGTALYYLKILPATSATGNTASFRLLLFSVVIQMVGFLLPAPLLLKFTRAHNFTFLKAKPGDIFLCCALIFSSLIFFSMLYEYLHIEPKQLAFIDGADILRHKNAFLAVTVLAVPGYEEWIFRGLMFGILVTGETRARNIFAAGLFCALVFTASHIEGRHSLSALPPIFVMAIIFQYMTWRSQSLWPAVCGHALQNLLSSVAFFAKFAADTAK